MNQFSQNEVKLFKELNAMDLIELSFDPITAYNLLVNRVFINDMQGPAVNALRRGFKAIHKFNPHRMTEEYEELIQFGVDND